MHTQLQLMIFGSDLQGSKVELANNVKGMAVGKVYDADSKNYIFVDVKVGWNVEPGKYQFVVTTKKGKELKFDYVLKERRENSGKRLSFGSADMVYLIMPDRFANGDSSNDSTDETVEKADRKNPGGRHGGDIQGIINHLDYLENLGVTAVWSTPLLLDNEENYSYHGYACADYYKIDPRYGSNELYRDYVAKAHDHDIKVIMDMVVNHCGTAHWWMKDLPFKDWVSQFDEYTRSNYALNSHADPHASEADISLCTNGWFDTTMPDMNLKQPFLLRYFTQWAVWWVEYADLDGLRVDTFPYSDKKSIAEWVKNVLDEYRDLNIVAECWYPDALSVSYWEGARRQHDGYCSHLPSVMDFPLRDAIVSGFADEKTVPDWGEGLVKIYNSVSLDYAYKNPYNLLIFADNHDTNRIAHDLDKDFAKMKMVMTLLSTMRGVPQLYYGDELGFTSADGSTGHSQERIDFPGGWSSDKVDLFDAKDRSVRQKDLFDYTSALFTWRRTNDAVHNGKLIHFRPTECNVYVYFRYTNDECVMTVINNGQQDYRIEWDRFWEITSKYASKGRNIITHNIVKLGDNTSVPAQSSAVIEFSK